MTEASKLRPRDAPRVAATGLRARPLRAVLSALGDQHLADRCRGIVRKG